MCFNFVVCFIGIFITVCGIVENPLSIITVGVIITFIGWFELLVIHYKDFFEDLF